MPGNRPTRTDLSRQAVFSASLPVAWTILLYVYLHGLVFTPAVTAQITAQQANKSIDLGVRYLKNQYKINNNHWPEYAAVPGGVPALCTLALLP